MKRLPLKGSLLLSLVLHLILLFAIGLMAGGVRSKNHVFL